MGQDLPALPKIENAHALCFFGDSITTDHISPAGNIAKNSCAARFLASKGVEQRDFNSYGARRGNDEVMARGTFANVRLVNKLVDGPGPKTTHVPSGEVMDIFDAAMRYRSEGMPTIIVAGQEYGSGSSRDWAAKGPQLLGTKAVIVRNFERIHRANLVFMGVLPLQFKSGTTAQTLKLDGSETIDITGIEKGITPMQDVKMTITRKDGKKETVPLTLRIDTPIEVDYYNHGGILPFVLRQLLAA